MNVRAAPGSGTRGRCAHWGRLISCLILWGPGVAPAGEWQVQDAPIRFTLEMTRPPTHPEAGYIAQLPDGGLLPATSLRTRVIAANGQPLESHVLWHGARSGLWIVFADPGPADPGPARQVEVYVAPSPRYPLWTPSTGLRPSPMLVADTTTAKLNSAKRLAALGRVGQGVHARAKAGIRRAPLSVGGDDTGRPRPSSFYLHAYLASTDPGRTWIAPVVIEGENEVHIDGIPLKPKTRTTTWGGTGQWVDLDAGFHRVEVFTASKPSGPYTGRGFRGHMYLAWRTPNMPASELGGVQSHDQPQPGAPRWEARIVRNREIVRSGRCVLEGASSRDGAPVACFTIEPEQNYWFEDEEPLSVFRFTAVQEGNPDDTSYHWTLEGGAHPSGASIRWLVPGLREHQVTLTARSARGTSSATTSFFGYSTVPSSMNRAQDRLAFRLAMQTVLDAYPRQVDPCTEWGDAYWNTLLRTAEYGKGYPLLRNLLGQRAATVAARLKPEDVRRLENIFLDVAPRVDPTEALQRIAGLRLATPLPDRRAELDIREAEVHMIYLDQLQTAGKILARIVRAGQEPGERAKIRLGDLYLRQGALNQASRLYADVQQRARHGRDRARRPGERVPEIWRMSAVQDAAHSATIASLVAEEEFLLAREALDRWERSFPLSKISEDFVLREAQLYMAITDWKRARWLLEPYCRTVDASSYLPEAATALLRCMRAMNESPEMLSETADMLKKRLEFHPVAEELERYIEPE